MTESEVIGAAILLGICIGVVIGYITSRFVISLVRAEMLMRLTNVGGSGTLEDLWSAS